MEPKRLLTGMLALALLLGAAPAAMAAPDGEGLEAFVDRLRQEWNIPGLAVAIVDGDRVRYLCLGRRDLEAGLPVTENTLFAIGSLTKSFTATLLGTLVDEGKVGWDDLVRGHLPGFRLHDPVAGERATVRDLLAHRTGLARHDMMWCGGGFSGDEIFARLRYLEPCADFREGFHYSNLIYLCAGRLAARAGGRSWDVLLRERLFGPLGMGRANTTIDDLVRDGDFARPYEEADVDGRPSLRPMAPKNVDAVGPAGSINASISEMASWLRLNMNDGSAGGRRIVSAAALAEIHSPQVVIRDESVRPFLVFPEMPWAMYGFGWYVQPYRGRRLVHHGGTIHGYTAEAAFLPDEGIGVVVLTNHHTTPFPMVLTWSLLDRLLGYEPADWGGRYRAIKARLAEAAKEEQAAGSGDPAPAVDRQSCAGAFEHPGYGELRIERDGEGLRCAYQRLETGLASLGGGVFEALDPPFTGLTVSFEGDGEGVVGQLSIPLDSSVPAIVFTREPAEE